MATKKIRKTLKILILFFVFSIVFFGSLFVLFHFGFLSNFASTKFNQNKLNYLTSQAEVYSSNNNKLNQNIEQTKIITYDSIPQHVIDAFVSIEDKKFFSHNGINYKRMIKAFAKNVASMKIKEGASTISQQLIKNTHLTNEKTIKRKINELLLTQQLEKELSKKEIFTAYLNAIYFGSGAFGINSASQRFFSKDVSKLTLAESATLAGIIKSPKLFSPISESERCLKRRNLVLNEMYKDNKISQLELAKAKKEALSLNINKNFLGNNDYYSASIDEACEILKITEKDLILKKYKIITYADENLQNITQKEVKNSNKNLKTDNANFNADVLAMIVDNKTGGVKAFSGKSDFNLLNIYRQPGSALKPIISYAPAIEADLLTPLTPILDEKIDINGYKPSNYNDKYYGWISAKQALAKSLNIPSIKVLEYVGVENAKNFAKNMGITFSNEDNGHSLALGGMTKGVKFKDLLNCYQAFANNGKQIKLAFVKEIQTKDGLTIYRHNTTPVQVMKSSTAFLINNMLKESVLTGTSKKLNLNNVEVCAKTGTVGAINTKQKENTDAWSISYTPETSTCIWIGSTNSKKLLPKNITGGSIPVDLAQKLYKNQKFNTKKFEIPSDIQLCEINDIEYISNNKISLCSPNTPDRYKRQDYFSKSNLPKETSNMFNKIEAPKIDLINCEQGKIEIKLDAKKFLTYDLYRKSNIDNVKICSISNKQGEIVLKDTSILPDKFYTYYVAAKYTFDNNKNGNLFTADTTEMVLTNQANQIVTSNEIKIFLAQKSPLIIHKKWA